MAEIQISLTTLYALIQDLRQDFTGRFDGVDKRFDAVDIRFDGVDTRIDGVDTRIGGVDTRIGGIDKRLERVETVQNTMALRLISIETAVIEHGRILGSLRIRTESLHGLVEELERRTGRIEQEYVMITEALRRLESRFDRIEAERLKERIAALEARVQALEIAQP